MVCHLTKNHTESRLTLMLGQKKSKCLSANVKHQGFVKMEGSVVFIPWILEYMHGMGNKRLSMLTCSTDHPRGLTLSTDAQKYEWNLNDFYIRPPTHCRQTHIVAAEDPYVEWKNSSTLWEWKGIGVLNETLACYWNDFYLHCRQTRVGVGAHGVQTLVCYCDVQ